MGFEVGGSTTHWMAILPEVGEETAQRPSPLPLRGGCRGHVLSLGHLAGPSSGFQKSVSHVLGSGGEEDKKQGCSSPGVIFKIFKANMQRHRGPGYARE
jgi:hypothetical protein